MIFNTGNGFKVKVFDRGLVTMCELVNGEWQDCIFETYEEAKEAEARYLEFWKDK